MYDRHIEVKTGLVFITENDYIEMNVKSQFPSDVVFYIEYEGDWWIEKNPFNGREKNEDVRTIALQILDQAKEIFEEKQN
jgi:hypothetical protein